jgi:hypothetical protein
MRQLQIKLVPVKETGFKQLKNAPIKNKTGSGKMRIH